MKKITAFAPLFLAITLGASSAYASHHFESSLARKYPQFDLTDTYVFNSQRTGYTTFILDVNPKTTKDGTPGFGENGIYSFHIAADRALKKGMTITAVKKGMQWTLGMINEPNADVGLAGKTMGVADVGKDVTLKNDIRVWSGAARDPFVGNSAGLAAFRQKLNEGSVDLSVFDKGVDLFAKLNTSVLLIEVPNKMLPENISFFASTAMNLKGSWVQVNRMANPLMTHLFMENSISEVNEQVHHRPNTDNERAYVVSGMVLRAAAIDGMKDSVAYADSVAKKLMPDLIPYKVGTPAAYTFESINGRKPQDDAMDAVLSIFLGKKVTDHANTFDRQPSEFPYVKALKSIKTS